MTRLARTPAILGILVSGMVAGGLPSGCSSNPSGLGQGKVDAHAPALDAAAGRGGATAAPGSGGTAAGGAAATGGIRATGGSATTGGTAGEGSTTGPGGAGGATGAGGVTRTGGATGAGGTTRAGGATGTGGATKTGGATASGGTGGATGAGGATRTGGTVASGGTGGTGKICGGLAGLPCADGEICDLPTGHCCCDFTGTCAARPQICSELYQPVCGCDGKTYGNDCQRQAAGVSKNFDGPCTGTGGSTGAGGSTGTGGITGTGGTAGAGSGGTATGGSPATGGTTTGGSGGTRTGGAGGSSGGYPECTTENDCQLISDCCNCLSIPKGSAAPSCNVVECFASNCETRGIKAGDVACLAGRCTFSRTCNPAGVTCAIPIAACPAGQANLIVGSCYSGGCVPVEECADVASCDVCKAAGLACVTFQTRPVSYHCVSTPPQCGANPTCACMGICSGALSCIATDSGILACQCPEC